MITFGAGPLFMVPKSMIMHKINDTIAPHAHARRVVVCVAIYA